MPVLTGTGDRFMTDIDDPSLGEITKPAAWDRTVSGGAGCCSVWLVSSSGSATGWPRVQFGMPLEGLTVADLAYQGWWRPLSRTGGARR